MGYKLGASGTKVFKYFFSITTIVHVNKCHSHSFAFPIGDETHE